MHKLFALAGAVSVAALLSLSAATPSSAHSFNPVGAGIVGGVLGFMAGAAIASSAEQPYYGDGGYDDGSYAWRQHVRACFRAYGDDYDPRTDTYLGDDDYDHRCRL
jgi:hypothetical protein